MAEHFYATGGTEFERLLSLGFSIVEAEQLIHMRDHVSEQVEYREMIQESRRMDFVRWLIEHDRISK